jgi:calcineurin-like phosphoesterase family protein
VTARELLATKNTVNSKPLKVTDSALKEGKPVSMRICIISDLHANIEALSTLPRDYNELWVLGDLVNYGPDPAATIDFVRSYAATVIRGNHDHSVGFGADCGCSPRFRAMAEATRDYTSSVL